jgi:hypothetical protein
VSAHQRVTYGFSFLSLKESGFYGREISNEPSMKKGYYQKLLRVNLTTKQTAVHSIAEEDVKKFIGGAGLGTGILRRELPGRLSVYDSRSKIIFGAGPFQGPPVAGVRNSASPANRS